jgi:Membrane carboxypeptidase/penicillin-binding protein
LHYITQEQYDEASKQPLVVKGAGKEFSVHAEYVAEMVRQMMYAQYREEAYTRGLNVVTTSTRPIRTSLTGRCAKV